VGETQCDRVERDVGRARRVRSGRRGQRGLGHFPHAAGAAPAARPHRGHERFQVRLAGQAGVQRLEEPGRVEQDLGRVGAALLVKGDLPAQVLHLRGGQRVERAGLGHHQQFQCRIEGTRLVFGPRRREHPLRPASRAGGQLRSTLQERSRGGESAAALRPVC
jgi:hypothetical protein